ncbi:hypothetical protein D3C78_1453720 [compost metagenome]
MQVDPQRQRQAHDQAAEQQAAVDRLRRLGGAAAAEQDHQRQHGEGGQGEAQAGVEEGADGIHAQALRNEGGAPDHRGE